MLQPDATIVVTTRDRPELVEGAVDSALAQTLRAVEVIVVDDASTEPLQPAQDDERLRLLRNSHPRGVCAARNLGLQAARGRWITFLDDDDRLLPDMLSASLQAAHESTLPHPLAVLSALVDVDTQGRITRRLRPATVAKGGHYSLKEGSWDHLPAHNTLVAPTDVVRAIGGWDEALRTWEHTDFFLRLNAVCSIQGLDRVTYRRLVHRSDRLSQHLPDRADSIERTLAKHSAAFARHPRRHAHYLRALGLARLRMGQWGPAVRESARALLVTPGSAKSAGQLLASLSGPLLFSLLDPSTRRPGPGR